jgi:hypothetical protein
VVADAVAVEPISTGKFPGNREIIREFCNLRGPRRDAEVSLLS